MADHDVPQIVPIEAARRVASGALLVDVRESYEWREAHVPGSTLLPMSQLPDRIQELPRDRPVLVLCAAGSRSHAVATYLRRQGIDAANVAGGIQAWHHAGLPIET